MMKILLLLLFPFLSQADNIKCKDLREGHFKLESKDGTIYTIVRTKDKQTENNGKTGVISESDIKWTSDYSYLLFNRKVIKGSENRRIKIDTVYNEIVEINDDHHKVITSIKMLNMKIESVLVKLDATTVAD